jgi:UDP-N-acetylglucosamine:LPS N-acetylglucosamine transferase
VEGERAPVYQRSRRTPHLFEISRRDWAIVSKPGGSTLNDSLAAATPLVLLEPYGDHERANAELWVRHGIGIRYHDWLAQGCPEEPLAEAHQKLLRLRARLFVYQERYLRERLLASTGTCERQP